MVINLCDPENLACQVTTTAWDCCHKVSETQADGSTTSYSYDQFGNLTSVTDPLGNATVYEYDLRGRKTYEGGATYPVRYTYDIFGNKTTMMTYRNESLGPDSGDVTTWLYDEASGTMTNKVYADGKGPTYNYTPDGKLSRRIWARGITTDYSYDNWGSLVNIIYSDGTPIVYFTCDVFGRRTESCDAAGATTFSYDSFGSITKETMIGVAGTNIIERYYDNFGRNAGYAFNGVRQTTLAYDTVTARLSTMLIPSAQSNNPNNQTIKQFSRCPTTVWAAALRRTIGVLSMMDICRLPISTSLLLTRNSSSGIRQRKLLHARSYGTSALLSCITLLTATRM